MAENKHQKELQEVRKEIDLLETSIRELDAVIISLSSNARSAMNSVKAISPAHLNTQLQQQQALIEKLNKEIKEQSAAIGKLVAAKSKESNISKERERQVNRESAVRESLYRQRVKEEKQNMRNLQLAAREKAAMDRRNGAYNKLITAQKKAATTLKNLIASQTASNRQIRVAQREYNKYTARVNQANAATSNFNRKSLMGAVSGFRNLLGAFGVVGGAFLFADLARNAFNLTKKLDSMNFSMRATIKNANELAMAKAFLSDISERYGQDILKLTDRFIKFRVAAEQSNVSFAQTIQIFDSFTEVAGVLGLQSHELEGLFLALEQMMSKGKITTEELRRQLGERLPGAFGTMADALEVSIDKLDDMLRKGEVLSAETLPKFAKAVQEAFDLKNSERIETLTAETTRMSNAWTELVAAITKEEGAVQSSLIAFMELGTRTLNAWAWIFSSEETIFTKELNKQRLEGLKNAIEEIDQGAESAGISVREFASQNIEFAQQEVEKLTEKIKPLREEQKRLDEIWNSGKLGRREVHYQLMDLNEDLRFQELMLENAKGALEGYNSTLDETKEKTKQVERVGRQRADVVKEIKEWEDRKNISTKEGAAIINEQIAILKKELEAWDDNTKKIKDNNDGRKATKEAIEGSMLWLDAQISALEDEQSRLATNSEEWLSYQRKIDSATEARRKFNEITDPTAARGELITTSRTEEESQSIQEKTFRSIIDGFGGGGELDPAIDSVEKLNEAIKRTAEETKIAQEKMAEMGKAREFRKNAQESMFMVMDSFSEMYKIDLDQFKFLFDEKENTFEDWASAGKEMVDFVLDSRLHSYEVELQEAIRTRDLILNNELATEEQKRIARRQFDEEEARIKNERAKKERENALIQIAIDTALAVTKSLPNFVLAGIVGAIGLAQAAFVASQPLPQFAEGHLSGTHEGAAIINDANRSNYQEVVERKSGGFEVYKGRNQVINMQKGDKVHKSFDSFMGYHNLNEMEKSIWMMNLQSMAGSPQSGHDRDIVSKLSMLNESFNKNGNEVKRLASRPIHNTVKVVQPRKPYYG